MPTDYAVPPPLIQLNQQHQQSMMLQMQLQQQKADGLIPGLEDEEDNDYVVNSIILKTAVLGAKAIDGEPY